MSNRPIKCAARDVSKTPFYLIQKNGPNKRYVAAFRDAENIRRFLVYFAEKADGQVQLKIRDYDDREDPQEFTGVITKERFVETLDSYSDLLLHDGYHELMIRLPETGDYVAFDEHGLLFVYTDEDYSGKLGELGLEYRPNERLIYEYDHWHVRSANGAQRLGQLIGELKLERLYN